METMKVEDKVLNFWVKVSVLLVCLYFLAGVIACSPKGSTPTSGTDASIDNPTTPIATEPDLVAEPDIDPSLTAPTGAVALTYYTDTRAVSSLSFKGSCVTYETNTYCWDDGIRSLGGQSYSYWGVNKFTGTAHNMLGDCRGTCNINGDILDATPTLVTANVTSYMSRALSSMTPSLVFSFGTATNVSCTLTASVLDCVDFSIDLSQAAL